MQRTDSELIPGAGAAASPGLRKCSRLQSDCGNMLRGPSGTFYSVHSLRKKERIKNVVLLRGTKVCYALVVSIPMQTTATPMLTPYSSRQQAEYSNT